MAVHMVSTVMMYVPICMNVTTRLIMIIVRLINLFHSTPGFFLCLVKKQVFEMKKVIVVIITIGCSYSRRKALALGIVGDNDECKRTGAI